MPTPVPNPTPNTLGAVCSSDQCTARGVTLYGESVLVEDRFGCERRLDPKERSVVTHYMGQTYYGDGSDDFPIYLTSLPSAEGSPPRALVQDSAGRVLSYDASALDLCIRRGLDQTTQIDIVGFEPSVPINQQRCLKKWNPGTAYGAGIIPVVYWDEVNQRVSIYPLNQTDEGGTPPPVSGPESFEVWDGAATQLLNAFDNASPWYDGTDFYNVNAGEFKIPFPPINPGGDDLKRFLYRNEKIDLKQEKSGSADLLSLFSGTLPGAPAVLKRIEVDISVGCGGNQRVRMIWSKDTDREFVFWADGDTVAGHAHHQQTTVELGHVDGVVTWDDIDTSGGHLHLYPKNLVYGYPIGNHYS